MAKLLCLHLSVFLAVKRQVVRGSQDTCLSSLNWTWTNWKLHCKWMNITCVLCSKAASFNCFDQKLKKSQIKCSNLSHTELILKRPVLKSRSVWQPYGRSWVVCTLITVFLYSETCSQYNTSSDAKDMPHTRKPEANFDTFSLNQQRKQPTITRLANAG